MCQFCTGLAFAFAEKLPGDKGVAFEAFVPPAVLQFFLRNYFKDFAHVDEFSSILFRNKREFESHLRFELSNVEEPLLDILGGSDGFPDFRDRRIVGSF